MTYDQYKEGASNHHPVHKLVEVRNNSIKLLISSQISRKEFKQFKLLMWSNKIIVLHPLK